MRDTRRLSEAQERCFNAILTGIEATGYPPSIRELCAMQFISSSSTVHALLRNLERKGFITRNPAKPRSIALTMIGKMYKQDPDFKLGPKCCLHCGEKAGATHAAKVWKSAAKNLKSRNPLPRRVRPPVAKFLRDLVQV